MSESFLKSVFFTLTLRFTKDRYAWYIMLANIFKLLNIHVMSYHKPYLSIAGDGLTPIPLEVGLEKILIEYSRPIKCIPKSINSSGLSMFLNIILQYYYLLWFTSVNIEL